MIVSPAVDSLMSRAVSSLFLFGNSPPEALGDEIPRFREPETVVESFVLPLIGCVTVGKSLHLSDPPFSLP